MLTLIDVDSTLTTIEFNIRFLAPCREAVVARARVLKAGRTLLTGNVDLQGQTSGQLFAVCGLTYMRLRPRG
jgi:acyl-coenzyme A thioesterase PaaI-like protein